MESKAITLDIPITNEKFETLIEIDNTDILVGFFWDSHGRLVSFPSEKHGHSLKQENVSVKIVKNEYTQMGHEWETWQLFINGKRVNGDVREYNYMSDFNIVDLKVIIGWG